MVGLFKRLFDSDIQPAIREELSHAVGTVGLDLTAAIAAHRNWRMRLENVLAGRSTEELRPEEICFDDRCALGKWIHGPAQATLGHLPGYRKLVSDHRMFHHAASNVVALAQAGKAGEALRIFEGPYETASASVIAALEEIRSLLANEDALARQTAEFPSLRRQLVRRFCDLTGPSGDAIALRLERATDAMALKALLPAAAECISALRGVAASRDFLRLHARMLAA